MMKTSVQLKFLHEFMWVVLQKLAFAWNWLFSDYTIS